MRFAAHREGARLIAPILPAAFAFGASFGLLARAAHMGTLAPIVMSATTFAGSAQFAVVSVFHERGSVAAAVAAAILLNARYAPIGISIARAFDAPLPLRALQAQLIVDESWAVSTRARRFDPRVLIGAGLVLYVGWIGGTALPRARAADEARGGPAQGGRPAVTANYLVPATSKGHTGTRGSPNPRESLIRVVTFLSRRPIPPSMGRAIGVLRSRKVRIGVNAAFVLGALVVTGLTVRHFLTHGWPLRDVDPTLVGVAAVLFVLGYAFKAVGWQYLFPPGQRPSSLNLAAAGGAASVGGIALPGRFDEAIRIAIVRKAPGKRVGFGVICLSLIVLGWIDSAALTPMAATAAAGAEKTGVQIGFALLAGIGIVAAGAVVALPFLSRTILRRFKLAGWVREHCACPREASKAWLCVSVSWGLRGAAVFVLLHGLAVGASFPLALAFLCASAASAALPIAPAGAATQAGAGAAILVAGGVSATNAIAFGVAAQALVILSGALCVVAAAAWHGALRLKPRLSAA